MRQGTQVNYKWCLPFSSLFLLRMFVLAYFAIFWHEVSQEMTFPVIRGQMMELQDTAATHYAMVFATAQQQPVVSLQDFSLSQG